MIWRAITATLLTGAFMGPATAAQADDGRVFAFRDARIKESSGLVDLGALMVTTNDSGDPSRLFVVSSATGRTVGVVDFHAETLDVEALAPAGGSAVWVGDIGDNGSERTSVSVYLVPVRTGRSEARPARYRLVYPRGAHDAESLFTDRQGRLHVITKSVLGGTVYRAPLRLSRTRPNRLQPEGRVLEYATDAAMLPDGRHVLVRGPQRASVYSYPGFRRVGSFALPRQRQGEGVSVGPRSRIRLSSEGVRSAVRQVVVPAAVRARLQPAPAPSASPSAAASASPSAGASASVGASPSVSPSPVRGASPSPAASAQAEDGSPVRDRTWLMWSIPGVLGLGAIGMSLGLRRRAD
ncbi:MAG: hypothetical protein JWQ93_93 [Marmoricola sp.]|nr:hypothetical protein [Marmoricola sp.]